MDFKFIEKTNNYLEVDVDKIRFLEIIFVAFLHIWVFVGIKNFHAWKAQWTTFRHLKIRIVS